MLDNAARRPEAIRFIFSCVLGISLVGISRQSVVAQREPTGGKVYLPVVSQGDVDDDCHVHAGIVFCHAGGDHLEVDTPDMTLEQQAALTERAANNPDIWRTNRVGDASAK
jgi:hypothetical protein